MSLYELAILGNATEENRARLIETISDMVSDFGLKIDADVIVHDAMTITNRDPKAAFAGTYFGGDPTKDTGAVYELLQSSAPVIPTVSAEQNFTAEVPANLLFSNGLRRRNDDPHMKELAAALLECVGLLRKQRRVFISYRRVESRAAAMQLHDLLTSRGFDVFLDTHDVRPGEPFQDVLWHRLCDSDVVVMLDTPTYFASKWTRQEFGRARAKEIHVLRIVWPEHTPNRQTEMAETIYLNAEDLIGTDGPISQQIANHMVLAVERLRSKSIASRYMAITGRLRADIDRIGASIAGIGSHRAIAIQLEDQRHVWAYPVVGIPTAELFNDVAEKARRADQRDVPILVYDHIGISDAWISHLKWLDDNIRGRSALYRETIDFLENWIGATLRSFLRRREVLLDVCLGRFVAGLLPPFQRISVARRDKLLCFLLGGLSGVIRQPFADLEPINTWFAESLGVSTNLEHEFCGIKIPLYSVLHKNLEAQLVSCGCFDTTLLAIFDGSPQDAPNNPGERERLSFWPALRVTGNARFEPRFLWKLSIATLVVSHGRSSEVDSQMRGCSRRRRT